jgi:hypothetical protein
MSRVTTACRRSTGSTIDVLKKELLSARNQVQSVDGFEPSHKSKSMVPTKGKVPSGGKERTSGRRNNEADVIGPYDLCDESQNKLFQPATLNSSASAGTVALSDMK